METQALFSLRFLLQVATGLFVMTTKKDMPATPQDRLQRWYLLQMVIDGRVSLLEASRALGVSYRHAKRLKQAVVRNGVQGLVHGNTGKKAYHALDDRLKNKISKLARTPYAALNTTELTRVLHREHGIQVCRETVRRILRDSGITAQPLRSPQTPIQRHPLVPPEGFMVLWGGLSAQWLGRKNPEYCFMAAVDVATMKCLAARFFQKEGSEGYLWLLKKIVTTFGIPVSFCQHSASAVKRRDSHWSIEEELRGEQDPTQAARALRDLGIVQYLESKSRVESISSLFKDSLRSDLRRKAITSIDQANGLFMEQFIGRFNSRYAASEDNHGRAWRTVPIGVNTEMVCSFRHEAMVDARNQVAVGDVSIRIPPGVNRISYARAHVDVRQFLDGSWGVYYNGNIIAEHAPTPLQDPLHGSRHTRGLDHSLGTHFMMMETDEHDIF
jgi:transposase